MAPTLKETCGVMIYQEDVIRVAHEIAGMSLGEADPLRRAMSGKQRSPLAMNELEQRISFESNFKQWREFRNCQRNLGQDFHISHHMLFAKLTVLHMLSFLIKWHI